MPEEDIKRTYIGAEVDDEVIEQIKKQYLDTKEYRNMSEFLRSLIDERLDPGKMDEIEEEKLLKLLEKPRIQERARKLLLPAH
jgi:Arc/MetJ-type ribon-helix-helix transcriptional regulator